MAKTETPDTPTVDDLTIVPFKTWCRNKGFSYLNGRRMVARGQGPKLTKTGVKMVGVQARHDREWCDQHTIAPPPSNNQPSRRQK